VRQKRDPRTGSIPPSPRALGRVMDRRLPPPAVQVTPDMKPAAVPDLTRAAWRKSSRSSGGGSNCIEIARLSGRIAIRDSKDPEGAALIVTSAGFRELTDSIRRGTVSG
jgi:Domain of unknown function (DUF397)